MKNSEQKEKRKEKTEEIQLTSSSENLQMSIAAHCRPTLALPWGSLRSILGLPLAYSQVYPRRSPSLPIGLLSATPPPPFQSGALAVEPCKS